jgi:hypothetical protein
MNNRDDDLTIENVDEQVEEFAHFQVSQPPPAASLARTIRNLQSIYAEDSRQADIWARINSRASALASNDARTEANEPIAIQSFQSEKRAMQESDTANEPIAIQSFQSEKRAMQESDTLRVGSFNSLPQRRDKQQPSRHWRLRNLGIGLVAAIALIVILAWPIFYYVSSSAHTASPHPSSQTATPQLTGIVPGVQANPTATPSRTAAPSPTGTTPTQTASGMQTYSGQYFTIQYPANWVIASVTTGSTYKQTVQFRPSATSPIFVNVDVLYASYLTDDLLLLLDPDVKLGTLLGKSTVTYHGIPWVAGFVDSTGSAQSQPEKLEIAYSNQKVPYRIEFGAPPDQFNASTTTFNAIFASFYPAP